MKTLLFWLVSVVMFALAAGFIMTQMPGASFRGALGVATEEQQTLADDLARHVDALANDAGTRGPHQPTAMNDACDYLKAQLRRAGYEVRNGGFESQGQSVTNLEVTIVGQRHPEDIILVGAHYDSEAKSPGADANASGCAVLMEIAKAMSGHPCERTVRFVFFPNGAGELATDEKSGAARYAREARKRGDKIVAMLSLDGLGFFKDAPGSQKMPFPLSLAYPDTGNFVLFAGDLGSRDLVRTCVEEFRKRARFPGEGLSAPGFVAGLAPSDNLGFRTQEFPAILVTDTGKLRYAQAGGPSDTADKLDFARMARVTGGLVHVVQCLAQRSAML